MQKRELKLKRFADVRLMNWLRMDDHWFCEIGHEQVFIWGDQGWGSYYRVELYFQKVEYMNCPTYLRHNIEWRLATPNEVEEVLRQYIVNTSELDRARRECQVYCICEVLSVYDPASRPRRDPHTFYIVAHNLEILVYYGGNFDNLNLSQFE